MRASYGQYLSYLLGAFAQAGLKRGADTSAGYQIGPGSECNVREDFGESNSKG